MPRASESQKAERLNRARDLLRQIDRFSAAVDQLAKDCSISPRQAYRYLEQARRLKGPVSQGEANLGKGQQSFLVGCHQALAALLHASLFPAQFLFALAQW